MSRDSNVSILKMVRICIYFAHAGLVCDILYSKRMHVVLGTLNSGGRGDSIVVFQY
jgi:hypothetical protein